jgi:hypothetical protein
LLIPIKSSKPPPLRIACEVFRGKIEGIQFQIPFPRSLNAIRSRSFPLVKSFI